LVARSPSSRGRGRRRAQRAQAVDEHGDPVGRRCARRARQAALGGDGAVAGRPTVRAAPGEARGEPLGEPGDVTHARGVAIGRMSVSIAARPSAEPWAQRAMASARVASSATPSTPLQVEL
jgi:hypothetical protein